MEVGTRRIVHCNVTAHPTERSRLPADDDGTGRDSGRTSSSSAKRSSDGLVAPVREANRRAPYAEKRRCPASPTAPLPRACPQVGFSFAICTMSLRMFSGIRGRPACDFHFRNNWKPLRCQPIRVSGLTMTKASFQLHKRDQGIREHLRSRSIDLVGLAFPHSRPVAFAGRGPPRSAMCASGTGEGRKEGRPRPDR
jgi:hypothetical protein